MLTHRINCHSSQIHNHRKSVPCCSGLQVHLAIAMPEASVYDWVKSRRSHKREQEASQWAPCRLAKAAHEEDKDCRKYLRGKIDLECLLYKIYSRSVLNEFEME